MSLEIEKLEWDTEFFGFRVGKVIGVLDDYQSSKELEQNFRDQNYQLVYYPSPHRLPSSFIKSKYLQFNMVDIKTTYTKVLNHLYQTNPAIQSASSLNLSFHEKLVDMAIQSGVYSRFKTDPKINDSKWEELYRLWMINSLTGKIAEEVFVYMEEDCIAGFITLGFKNNLPDIGLIAVDASFRGHGIARQLINHAETWFLNKGYHNIQVVTQGENTPACKLYENCGFAVSSVDYFYHIRSK